MPAINVSTPSCTVRFDPDMGCGMNVGRRELSDSVLVGITFVTRRSVEAEHWITLGQAEQLRAALDAIIGRVPGGDDPHDDPWLVRKTV